MIDVKMGTYVIQTDFTVEESRNVVKRIWETIISSEYDALDMKESVSDSMANIRKMIKKSTQPEEYMFVRLLEELIYCRRRLYANEKWSLYK